METNSCRPSRETGGLRHKNIPAELADLHKKTAGKRISISFSTGEKSSKHDFSTKFTFKKICVVSPPQNPLYFFSLLYYNDTVERYSRNTVRNLSQQPTR